VLNHLTQRSPASRLRMDSRVAVAQGEAVEVESRKFWDLRTFDCLWRVSASMVELHKGSDCELLTVESLRFLIWTSFATGAPRWCSSAVGRRGVRVRRDV